MTVLTDVTEFTVFPLGGTDGAGSMSPDGVPGALTVGAPVFIQVIQPASFASTGVVSDVFVWMSTNTVFVAPESIDPSNNFGDTTILMKRLIFRPPTQTLGWGWYKRYEGVSLLKKDGVWSEVPWPTNEETQEADVYLGGGRDHVVSTELAAELIGEGYTVTEEY